MNKMKNQPRLLGAIVALIVAGGMITLIATGSLPVPQPAKPAQPIMVDSSQPSTVGSQQGRAILQAFSAAFEEAAAKTNPSVVPIFSEQVRSVEAPSGIPEDSFREFFGGEFFKRFFGSPGGDQKQTIRSLGSGVIVTPDGYVLTNNHVVAEASKLTVVLDNRKKYTAKVIGTDPQTDVAVIKIDASNLPAAKLGNSDKLNIGQWVVAVGNPFQLLHTVTAGIISAKGRSSVGLADYEDFIQTDASINPGNSGGALANLDGEVVGINTAIATTTGANTGVGFAIPISMARRVMDELIKKGKVTRGYLGIALQDIDEDLAKAFKLKDMKGALVGDVTSGSPAEKAGVKRGDVIVSFNGKEVESSVDLRNRVAEASPGSTEKMTILRNGNRQDISVTLGERPKELATATGPGGRRGENRPTEQPASKLGISVEPLTSDIAQQLGFRNERGVVIASVESGSPADEARLQRGDLIKEVNRMKINSMDDFMSAVRNLRSGETGAFLIRRGETTLYAAIKIP